MVTKKHNCDKEVVIATMTEKLANIEHKVDGIDNKLTKFIDTCDAKYATKEELGIVQDGLKDNTLKIWDMAQKLATLIALVGVIWIIVKGGI
jgi:hypothetical protein